MTSIFALVTAHQNESVDWETKMFKNNQKTNNACISRINNCYNMQSSFYSGKTFWMVSGRLMQVGLLGLSTYSTEMSTMFRNVCEKMPSANAIYTTCEGLLTPYYESKSPHIESSKLIEQKKFDTLTQANTKEITESGSIKQQQKNFMDTLQQLFKTFFD